MTGRAAFGVAPALATDVTVRRVLMIARDFPPANTSAALRALRFTRHLGVYGWCATVLTVRRGIHGYTDRGLLRDVPASCRILGAFGFDTKAVLSIRRRYLQLFATPDRSASWFPHGVVRGLRACRMERPDVVLSTSPPVTAHCIALAVTRRTRLPWVAELRDPWNLDRPAGPFARHFDGRLERQVLGAADRIVVTTEEQAAELSRRLGARIEHKICVIPNGYDEEGFARLPASAADRSRFQITHAGECTPPERDPVPFLRALRHCLDTGELPANTAVLFMGAGASFDAAVGEDLKRLRLDSIVRGTPRCAPVRALQSMLDASLLLLLQTRDAHRNAVPAKAYEYLRSGTCVLAVAPEDSATVALVKRFPGTLHAPPADPTQIARRLAEAYQHWKDAAETGGFTRSTERYSGERLGGRLAQVLDELRTVRTSALAGVA
jgi:glycosyltransferase involved in cell wall biosynthesis